MPIRWMRFLSDNGRFLNGHGRMRAGGDADLDAERQRPARSRRVPRREPEDDWAGEVAHQALNDIAGGDLVTRLVAAAHFPEHHRRRAAENAAERELGQHAVETIRALVHVLEKQHAAGRWIEPIWRT